ncbi:MAG TPA: alpha/beta hydrolase [Nitrococcus sp.]|nr:alpha/beta hydrolase [Nitrococcus sp.]
MLIMHLMFYGIFYGVALMAMAYTGLAVSLYLLQSRIAHHPNLRGRALIASPASVGLRYEVVSLYSQDGVKLHGWYIPAVQGRGYLLFCHGNAGNISHRLYSLRLLHRLGLSILIFDYRGYGLSEGSPSDEGLHLDAQAALLYLLEKRQVPPERLFILGRSLGGAIAAQLAAKHPPAALILDSTFTSAVDLAADLYPWLPTRWLTRLRYDTLAALRQIRVPVLILHSRDDTLITVNHGHRLYQAANEPKGYVELRGPHCLAQLKDATRYIQALDSFIDNVLGRIRFDRAS